MRRAFARAGRWHRVSDLPRAHAPDARWQAFWFALQRAYREITPRVGARHGPYGNWVVEGGTDAEQRRFRTLAVLSWRAAVRYDRRLRQTRRRS
jgi:hypothetical protein